MPPKLDNLRSLADLPPEEHKRLSSIGGKRSVKTRRRNRDIKKAVLAILAQDLPSKSGEKMTGAEGVARALLSGALKGNHKHIQQLLDLIYGRKQEVEMKGSVVTNLPDLNISFLPEKTDGGDGE